MAGKLGEDFDPTQPADSSPFKYGAEWIRDIKRRIRSFFSVLFNLETGEFKDSVIHHRSLMDSGVEPGTYSRVTVNAKGIVTDGILEDMQVSASLRMARFDVSGGERDDEEGVTPIAGSTETYDHEDSPYSGEYAELDGASYNIFSFNVPAGVRRLRVICVGAGGGASASYGGGGGEHVEATVMVTPLSSIAVMVGLGGAQDTPGGPSGVNTGRFFIEAGGGAAGGASQGGAAVAGLRDGSVGSFVCAGGDGSDSAGGLSGSHLRESADRFYGQGGFGAEPNGSNGLVILEWMVL